MVLEKKMVKQGMLMRNDVPGGKKTNSFIHTSTHLGNIYVPIMKQTQLLVMES